MTKKQHTISANTSCKNISNYMIKKDYVKNLKTQIGRLDGHVLRHLMPIGVESLDSALSGGLALGRVHMLCGVMRAHAVVSGLATALLVRLMAHMAVTGKTAGPVVWCPASGRGGAGMLYGHGLAALGFDPARLLIVDAPNPAHRMAALDDIVRTNGLAAVVAEYDGLQKPSDYWMRLLRRAQLAAEASRVTVFLLGAPIAANGCETIWHVAPSKRAGNVSSAAMPVSHQPWCPAWEITLKRARGGYPFHGHIGWDISSGQFSDLTALAGAALPEQTKFDMGPDDTGMPMRRVPPTQNLRQAV